MVHTPSDRAIDDLDSGRFDAAVKDENKDRPQQTSSNWHPFRILGYLAGGLSIINLVRDLEWITLKGALGQWVAEYDKIVSGVVNFLFRWIPVSWIEISDLEAHLLVIIIVMMSSILKANTTKQNLAAAFTSLVMLLALSVIVLLLPGGWGITVAALAAAVCAVMVVAIDSSQFPRKLILMNLGGIIGTAMLIVLASALIR